MNSFLLNYLSSLGYTLQDGDTKTPLYNFDAWIAVVAPEYSNGRDHICIGNLADHFVGKSHTEDESDYPAWGDPANTYTFKRFYCEVSEDLIYDFGLNLGLAFQLQDDYLDLYPKSAAMGKIVGGDLINKKKSIPYLLAMQESTPGIKQKIKELINSQDQDRIEKLKTVFEQIEVKEKTEKMIEEYFQLSARSLNSIEGFDLTSIQVFAEQLMQRKH